MVSSRSRALNDSLLPILWPRRLSDNLTRPARWAAILSPVPRAHPDSLHAADTMPTVPPSSLWPSLKAQLKAPRPRQLSTVHARRLRRALPVLVGRGPVTLYPPVAVPRSTAAASHRWLFKLKRMTINSVKHQFFRCASLSFGCSLATWSQGLTYRTPQVPNLSLITERPTGQHYSVVRLAKCILVSLQSSKPAENRVLLLSSPTSLPSQATQRPQHPTDAEPVD